MILHSAILFQWKDPVDSDWVFTRVVKKVGTPPLNPYDGELLYVESYIKNQYSSDGGIIMEYSQQIIKEHITLVLKILLGL